MKTQITVTAEDGTPINLIVPTHIPTTKRADYLRSLFSEFVVNDGHWKGTCGAVVASFFADDVAEAMESMGATVDFRASYPCGATLPEWANKLVLPPQKPGYTTLVSLGYWYHIGS